jgi:SAM-dependent methyltransferase
MENYIISNDISKMSYTQFIAYINQCNVPPGSLSTISEWAIFSNINEKSIVLEIACTTGFSGREISLLKNCKVIGIDICNDSIDMAIYNKKQYANDCDITYICEDFLKFETIHKFTHIILGAAVGFFNDKEALIDKCIELLDDNGFLLVSPYYLLSRKLNSKLINRTRSIIGITPTNFGYYTAMEPYKNFEIMYENRKNIIYETEEQMKKYCEDTIERTCQIRNINDENIKKLLFDRLYEIKDVSNELHKKHAFSILVLRYKKSTYPKRYIELF